MIEFNYKGIKYKYDNKILNVGNKSYDCAWELIFKSIESKFLTSRYLCLYISKIGKYNKFNVREHPREDDSFCIDLDLVEELSEKRNIYNILEE